MVGSSSTWGADGGGGEGGCGCADVGGVDGGGGEGGGCADVGGVDGAVDLDGNAGIASMDEGGAATDGEVGGDGAGGKDGGGVARADEDGGAGGGGAGAGGGGGEADDKDAPGALLKKNSSASEDDTHGTCSFLEARDTPFCVLLNTTSALRPGVLISFNSSETNRLFAPSESFTTLSGAAEKMASVPAGAVSGASPIDKPRKRRSNGFRRAASTMTSFTAAPAAFMSAKTDSMLMPSRLTSPSVQIWASTGMM